MTLKETTFHVIISCWNNKQVAHRQIITQQSLFITFNITIIITIQEKFQFTIEIAVFLKEASSLTVFIKIVDIYLS